MPRWCILAGQKQGESRLLFLVKRTGTVPIISTGASSFLVPLTYIGFLWSTFWADQLKILKTSEGEGEERECLFMFSVYKCLTFSILTLENPFVHYLNKSKQWYERGDFSFPLELSTFFACHLSQDRISPLEAAAFFRFQSQSLFIVTPICLCPFVNPLLDEWMRLYEKGIRWHLPGSKVPESFQFDRAGLRPTKCWQPGYTALPRATLLCADAFGQTPSSYRQY